MELAPLIRDLAVILCVAGLVSFLFHKIRQPVVLGYIIAGMIVGPFTPPYPLVTDLPSIRIWAELGVIFLMFSLGLEFSFRKLASVGLSASITGCFEVIVMIFLGFSTGRFLGWSSIDSVFLGAMLSISSTTIIIRALDELRLKSRRFAEMIFAVLIVEDLVAILILVGLSTFVIHRSLSGLAILASVGKLILVVSAWFLAGYFVIPRFIRYIGRDGTNEMLTLISLGFCLALVVFAAHFHYSAPLGAFIMGSILAESTESQRIEERLESLRDLFAAIFFVSIGMLMDPAAIFKNLGAVLIITLVTIIGKVFSTTLGALITGQTIRTSIQVGFGLTQIGEFSFIIAGLGQALEVTSDFLYPIAVAVSLITTFLTPYMIRVSHSFALALETRLPTQVKGALAHYSAWVQEKHFDVQQKQDLNRFIIPWLVNGIIFSVLFVASNQVLLPMLVEKWGNQLWVFATAWVSTILCASPFIWGMWSSFQRFSSKGASGQKEMAARVSRFGILLFFRLASLFWLGALSLGFFPIQYVFIFVLASVGVLLVVFYRQLEFFYRWFEKNFMLTFEVAQKSHSPTDLMKQLAPWDAHLVRIKVHPNAEVVDMKISDAQLRTRLGINVVVIQRGLRTIVAPRPDEVVLPGDELLVLATDEQLEASRSQLEKPSSIMIKTKPISSYCMRQARVTEHSPFLGFSIRSTGVREKYGAMVVGLQRGDQRIISPESDLTLEEGDLLWLVGERELLDFLINDLFKVEEVEEIPENES